MEAAISLNMIPDKHILVVDDAEDIRDFLVTLLSDEAKVSTATDGAEALAMVRNNCYDLIICDIDMPNLSGIDFYSLAIKKNMELKNKFMFFTGSIDSRMRHFIHQQQIFYLPKPSPISEIRMRAKVILNKN